MKTLSPQPPRGADGSRAPAVKMPGAVDAAGDPPGEEQLDESRAARKRRAIMEAATTLFLRNGYQDTSMDEIAALAAVSKQTVYKHFADKERLFGAITLGATERAEAFIAEVPHLLTGSGDLEQDLRVFARRYLAAVLHPHVLQLRRLVIAEAGRFPDLARAYYERAPERVLAALAASLQQLAARGVLRLDDPLVAAQHLAFLILGPPLDRAMFRGDDSVSAGDLEVIAEAGVRAFLAVYRR